MLVQRPAEIIARKIAYRSASFKMRDFFDLAALAQTAAGQWDELCPLINAHLDDLEGRWVGLSATLPQSLSHEVTPTGDGYSVANNIRNLMDGVFSRCRPARQP